jgi:hypothetical protein
MDEPLGYTLPSRHFFFVGFNLILWTKRLILEEHGVEFSGFLTATLAALLVDTGLRGSIPTLPSSPSPSRRSPGGRRSLP